MKAHEREGGRGVGGDRDSEGMFPLDILVLNMVYIVDMGFRKCLSFIVLFLYKFPYE